MQRLKFKKIEEQYNIIKSRLKNGEINTDEMKAELKDLMIQDDDGRYWMIGSKSGKWYVYDGSTWVEDNPFQGQVEEEAPRVEEPQQRQETQPFKDTIDTRTFEDQTDNQFFSEKDIETIATQEKDPIVKPGPSYDFSEPDTSTDVVKVCKYCNNPLLDDEICSICGRNQIKAEPVRRGVKGKTRTADATEERRLASIDLISLTLFFGGIGIIFGAIFGAIFGTLDLYPEFLQKFPAMLQDAHGQIQGGIIFAIIGAVAGGILFGIAGSFIASFYNIMANLFGGIKVTVK